MSGQLYIISGPSGVGKSTLIRLLRENVEGLGYSISHTSRRPRENETDAVDYHFVDRETFEKMIDEDAFAEWALVFDDYYGTAIPELCEQLDRGLDIILDLDSQGAKNIRGHFENSTLIFLLPPSVEILEKRLRDRAQDKEDVIRTRMKQATRDFHNCRLYDYILINDDLDETLHKLESIITAGRCRTANMLPRIKEILGKEGGSI